MQKYKSLEDLGVERKDCYTNWMEEGAKEDSRYSKWLSQREEFGIDERSTWNWSDDYMDYMYIHLSMFNDVNLVDFNKEYIVFNEQAMTVQEAIDIIIKWFKTRYYPKKSEAIDINDYDINTDEGKKAYFDDLSKWCNERHEIIRLFAEIIERLNW